VRTYTPKVNEITRDWLVLDAEGLVLGRLATVAASLLRGKHRTFFAKQNFHYHHSGYPGGLRATSWESLMQEDPASLVFEAVKGMVPKNRLGRAQMDKLFVYAGAEHPHAAQQPVKYDTSAIRRA
jgi:large subunit ribosomal protein L13